MKLCIFLCHLIEAAHSRNITLDEMLALAAGWGLEGVEADYHFLKTAPQSVFDALERANIPILAVYSKCDLAHGKDDDLARETLLFAAEHQISRVLIVPGYPNPGEEREEIIQEIIRRLQALCLLSTANGIHLSIENFGLANRPYHLIHELERLFAAVPALCYTLDIGNFMFAQENPLQAAALFAERIRHVHCKDFSLFPIECNHIETADNGTPLYPAAIGAGAAPLSALIAQLRAAGYHGALSIEQFGVADPFLAIEKSISFLRRQGR